MSDHRIFVISGVVLNRVSGTRVVIGFTAK